MSFDLFILHNCTQGYSDSALIKKLAEHGIETDTLPTPNINLNQTNELTLSGRLHPPLVNKITEFNDQQFSLIHQTIDASDLADYRESTDKEDITAKLSHVHSEIHITTSAGREDIGLILQCHLAAALADITGGVLLDPQEYGLTDGEQVYQVAHHHCKNELKSINGPSPELTNKAKPKAAKKPASSTLMVLLVLLFIALKSLLLDR